MGMLQKLMDRWNLKSFGQVIVVLVVFSLTGSTVLLIKKPIMSLIQDAGESMTFFNILYYILIIPMYNMILLCYGFLFGQFNFFWEFEKKTWRRITGRKAKTINE